MKLSEARKLYDEGAPLAQIAKLADLPVREIKFALGIDEDKLMLELFEQGMKDHEIAHRLNCSTSKVYQFRKRKELTRADLNPLEERLEEIMTLLDEGRTTPQIADILELPYHRVYYWMRRNKLIGGKDE